jgi:hypothetical protein
VREHPLASVDVEEQDDARLVADLEPVVGHDTVPNQVPRRRLDVVLPEVLDELVAADTVGQPQVDQEPAACPPSQPSSVGVRVSASETTVG